MSVMGGKKENQSPKGEYPVLIAIQGPLDGQRWNVNNDLIIGREGDCDIIIDDRQVSRHHARVFVGQSTIEI